MTILDELYIHVGEAHQYYRWFLNTGRLGSKHKWYTCTHWNPHIDYVDYEISSGPFDLWLLAYQECYLFSWEKVEEAI